MGMLHLPTAQANPLLEQHRHPQSKINARVKDFTLSPAKHATLARAHKKDRDERVSRHKPGPVELLRSQGDPDLTP